jgi:hypothetical protein
MEYLQSKNDTTVQVLSNYPMDCVETYKVYTKFKKEI